MEIPWTKKQLMDANIKLIKENKRLSETLGQIKFILLSEDLTEKERCMIINNMFFNER